MKHKGFERIIMRNTFAMVLPIMVLLFVVVYFGISTSFFHKIQCTKMDTSMLTEKNLQHMVKEGDTNVLCELEDLYYTGYDYMVDGKCKGAYYYTLLEESLQLVVIKTKEPEAHIDRINVKGRVLQDMAAVGHIIKGLCEYGTLDEQLMSGFYHSFIISEPDFPSVYVNIALILLVALACVYVALIAYVVYLWIHPHRHPQAKQLRVYGKRLDVIEELDRQLAQELCFKYRGIYVTTDYLIARYAFHTDVIRLDDVHYLSKNQIENKRGRILYRVTLANPETDLFYELDFKNEGLADACVSVMKGE